MFSNLGNHELMEIVVYADASHANLPNGASQSAWLVFISSNKRISLNINAFVVYVLFILLDLVFIIFEFLKYLLLLLLLL